MVAVREVQMTIDDIARMIAVRNRFVTAVGAVNVSCFVTAAFVVWRAVGRIIGGHFERVLIYMVVVHMMQMSVVQIVYVVAMLNRGVSTARAVLMFVVRVYCTGAHCLIPLLTGFVVVR
jgi:hypothetical protein